MKKFKSPPHKLIAFFEASRDSWKKRSECYKAKLESIRSKARSLERSRDNWKVKYQQLAGQLTVEKTTLGKSSVTRTDEPAPRAAMPENTAKSQRSLKRIKKPLI